MPLERAAERAARRYGAGGYLAMPHPSKAPIAPLAALLGARALLEDPARFTRSHTARNVHGDPTVATKLTAVRWDATGALQKVTGRRTNCPGNAELVAAAGGSERFWEITVRGTHADVLALYDKAIAALQP